MKNYYDILEISKLASPEVVEKAYKTLVKKHHPDLQSDNSKQNAENKMKDLNEAYEVISNPEKRAQYDKKLSQYETKQINTIHNKPQTSMSNQPSNTNSYQSGSQNNYDNLKNKPQKIFKQNSGQQRYKRKIEKNLEKAYYNAYVQELRNQGYQVKYKRSIGDYSKMFLRAIITLLISFLVLFLIYQIPFVKSFFTKLYFENEIFHLFIDIILNIFKNLKNIF